MDLRRFFSALFVLWDFRLKLTKYCKYLAYFVIFIRVLPDLILLSKYSLNAFLISDINKEKSGCGSMILLNIRFILSWIINNLYCNYLLSKMTTKAVRFKKKVIYHK